MSNSEGNNGFLNDIYQRSQRHSLGWIWVVFLFLEFALGEFFISSDIIEIFWYLGLIFLLTGVILVPVPFIYFPRKGKVPKGKSFFHTTKLVDSGIYELVRHPQHLGWINILFSFVLMKQHWIITICGILGIFLLYYTTVEEDKLLIRKFGDDYRKYMNSVPRLNLFLGIIRFIRRRRVSSRT
ncbi:MAG: methyltransferase family protein [Promethearchaeota archaeon]